MTGITILLVACTLLGLAERAAAAADIVAAVLAIGTAVVVAALIMHT